MFYLNPDIYIPIILVLIGFIIGKWRDNNKIVFNKKLEIYSEIIYKLNSGDFFSQNLKTRFDKTSNEFKKIFTKNDININQEFDDSVKGKIEYVGKEINDINYEFEKISHRNSLIKVLAPARIIGNRKVVEELRNYYDLSSNFLENEDKEKAKKINKDLNMCVMRLEKFMRQDLLGFWNKDLLDFDIKNYIDKNSIENKTK